MEPKNIYLQDLTRGLVKENPVFVALLGMCPLLGVTGFLFYGFGMGVATTAVAFGGTLMVSLFRNLIPSQVRIPIFIVIIATLVTVVEMSLEAFQPELHEALGVFVPLIVCNCLILGRLEAFSSKKPVLRSAADGIGAGLGFTLALVILAFVREVLGHGSLLGPNPDTVIQLFGPNFEPMTIFAQPAGAFIALGLLLALFNMFTKRFNI